MIGAILAFLAVALAACAFGEAVVGAARRLERRWRDARRRRVARLAFPGFIESIAAALASGLSLELALAEVAPSQPTPLDQAARRGASALRLGASAESAIAALGAALPEADLAPFAIVVAAFARAGGRIGRSLARVARLSHGRLALEDERAALTAQGRASALVLVMLAPLGAVFFASVSADYLPTLLGPGRGLLIAALALEATGGLWLWHLVRRVGREDDLASLIDAVVVGLDAGLTFQQSLAALVRRSARLARLPEARRLLADLTLGQGPRSSFARFALAGPAEARVASLVEVAIRFGSPLADLLVTQADTLRERERRAAEAAARRLPILMLFPLTLCVLPALLIVFLGPPLLSLID